MIRLSPSILAADFTILGEQMRKVEVSENAYFHVDVMDGHFVPNISFGMPIIESIRPFTAKTLDVHLMITDPKRYVNDFAKAGADMLTIHKEACEDAKAVIEMIHGCKMKAGVSIKPGTDVEELFPLIGCADMFLIMTVEPGFGGQKYMDICTAKIKKLREEIAKRGFDTDIEVDGGITRENVQVVLDAGANVIVMGSSIFKGDITQNVKYFDEYFERYTKGEV